MIQGGDPTGTGSGGPGFRFEHEIPDGHKYAVGELVDGQLGPEHERQPVLRRDRPARARAAAGKYWLFGQVEEGMEVVKKIEADGSTDRNVPRSCTAW